MNTIDLIFALILSYGLIKGMMKGFIVEIASLLALILGTYGAMHFSHFAAHLISQYVSWEEQYLKPSCFRPYLYWYCMGYLTFGKCTY